MLNNPYMYTVKNIIQTAAGRIIFGEPEEIKAPPRR